MRYREGLAAGYVVGAAGFEPAISRPQSERDARLRYAPSGSSLDR